MERQGTSFEKIHQRLWGQDNAYIQFLGRHRDRLFYSYPYPGNTGDNLIRKASDMLLHDLGIRITNNLDEADICLFAGGCPTLWPDVMRLIEAYLQSSAEGRLVIGPATFEFGRTPWPELFRLAAGKIAGLFARDWKSYQNLCSADLPDDFVKGVSHDPVFYLLGTPWHEQQRQSLSEEYILVSLRRDHEMKSGLEERILNPVKKLLTKRKARKLTRWARGKSKQRKLSRVLQYEKDKNQIVKDIDIWQMDKEAYLETIRKAARIYTDRLHVMAVASMLGKKVYAFSTSYGKLEHVYQTSMQDWANVTFWK